MLLHRKPRGCTFYSWSIQSIPDWEEKFVVLWEVSSLINLEQDKQDFKITGLIKRQPSITCLVRNLKKSTISINLLKKNILT